jgi:hypothetical protein
MASLMTSGCRPGPVVGRVGSHTRRYPWPMRKLNPRWVVIGAVIVAVGALVSDVSLLSLVVAVVAGALIFKIGFAILGGMAQPVPEPPPAGELRKVKIEYRCTICGTEMRMTVANDEMPDPPRHCLEDMDLVTPVE